MLFLLFSIQNDEYALSSSHIKEVIPFLSTEKIPMSPPYITGMINYRGTKVPVIDLSVLFDESPCKKQLSTRIILISIVTKDNMSETIGLIAENVTETIKMPKKWKPTVNDEGVFELPDQLSGKRLLRLFEPDQYLPGIISETITLCKTFVQ